MLGGSTKYVSCPSAVGYFQHYCVFVSHLQHTKYGFTINFSVIPHFRGFVSRLFTLKVYDLAGLQVAEFALLVLVSWDCSQIKGHDFTQAVMKNNIMLFRSALVSGQLWIDVTNNSGQEIIP